ncbi:Dps family protein [Lentibacillus sp. CBA3610]|uniref:Dps family protein n=1 Tax=Lentibacillus sp. CBA3610 TaxID=2518176 RepID=UPI0015961D15|nr:DNA starvation/stationary phase protection protein [Lentibacillus sp. CBA3610]QKY69100.1 DNA starvation/stationary phase protection protein [Lentibacillus sp. CBA3610]
MDNQKLINFLNQLLSNYFVMYVKLHRYHWFIQGKHFFQLHNVFEEMYTTIAEDLDDIAERVLMIDGKPLATMTKYIKEATLEEATADDTEDEITAKLIEDYQQLITEIKEEGIPYASERHDEPTLDLLISLQGKLEKYVWMMHAYRAYE